MPNWTELKRLQDELNALKNRGSLTYDSFSRILEQATAASLDAPRVLEAFIRHAPTEWLEKHLFAPLKSLEVQQESSPEPQWHTVKGRYSSRDVFTNDGTTTESFPVAKSKRPPIKSGGR
jgi:hypothetical protein